MAAATTTREASVDIRRADDRFATQMRWLDSKHSFSFGHHYSPSNTHHGLLLVNNDDIVAPGTGFDTHPHRDMEIVTWVLDGALVHQDSTGHSGVIYPGLAQRMSAGTGILHSEKNDSWRLTGEDAHTDPVHFVQMWVVPDAAGVTPGYEQLEIDGELLAGGLVTVASGMERDRDAAAIHISNRYAALHAARLAPGAAVTLPDAPFLHLFVPSGAVTLEGEGALGKGDAARFTGIGGHRVTAAEASEILVWEMQSHGYAQYEISNFAKPGKESRHNKTYWLNDDYYGIGAGAHGYANRERHVNAGPLAVYMQMAKTGLPRVDQFAVSEKEAMEDQMILGLRLREGVELDRFEHRFGKTADDEFGPIIAQE
ncbi:pirin family protein, partial [Frankia sp. CNm7]|nr:pirin family protein [Frankia nepalensis]